MEQHYHIIKQEKMPSSQEIEAYQDFDALLARHQTSTVTEKKATRLLPYWIVASLAMAASAVGVFFFWQLNPNTTTPYFEQQVAYFQEKPFIDRPFENINPIVSDFKINVAKTEEITSPKGTTLTFPEQAFQYEDGALAEGEVQVLLYEFQDNIDVFLSGIPTHYDSSGTSYTLQPANILEIYAEQNGKRLQLAAHKLIQVNFSSSLAVAVGNAAPTFNVYQLDTNARKWIYQEVHTTSKLTSFTTDERSNAYNELAQQEKEALAKVKSNLSAPIAPIMPIKKDKNLPTLELDFLESLTSEAKTLRTQYDGAVWQLTEKSPALPKDVGSIAWEDATITPLDHTNNVYELVLISQQRKETVLITPVLPSNAFTEAMKTYEQEKAAYELALQDYKKELELEEQVVSTAFEARKRNLLSQDSTGGQQLFNQFTINKLGIWMCGKPLLKPTQQLTLNLRDEAGNTYKNLTGYLFDINNNSFQRFLVSEQTTIAINPQIDYWLLVITEEKQIAILDPKALKEAAIKQQATLKLLDRPIREEADVRAVFNL